MEINLNQSASFESRHNGPWEKSINQMLKVIGVKSIDELIDQTVPASIRLDKPLNLPEPVSEFDFIKQFERLVQKNVVGHSFIGMGYYNTVTPPVIQRNILENPGWYTAYTPYQAEISQGRLEALVNFQTMVIDLTGMEIANASLLDEGTAAAEAMSMLHALRKGEKKGAERFFIDKHVFPQTIEVVKGRAASLGIDLEIGEADRLDLTNRSYFGLLLQYPNSNGLVFDCDNLIRQAKEAGILVAVSADLLSLTILKSPGEMGADVVVGTTQRFGIPLGFGGPHAAYFATKDEYKRQIPGRIIGVSIDKTGNKAYRMALQTREQHIRREKATSNICTAQVLLAVMAGMYAVYHGPQGLKNIAWKIHGIAALLEKKLNGLGYQQTNDNYFDTLKVKIDNSKLKARIRTIAEEREVNFRYFEDDCIGIALDETHSLEDVVLITAIFAQAKDIRSEDTRETTIQIDLPESLTRTSVYLEHPVFHKFHSEHEMLRYIKRLENKDLSLVHSMISLGSCTMKLNATAEMIPITWKELANIHPFAPGNQTLGYQGIFRKLEQWLTEITGFAATSLQPNSGAQGEYSGLMVISAYHKSQGNHERNVTLIPSSAHGTNPASAVMAGMKVVIVRCDEQGNIDVSDLREKAIQYRDQLAALMVTYPSTHGVYEEHIVEICGIIHENGGQVYMDGANMNAQVGITSPAKIGADVCHLNLHKTFCIPHGGGGPGVGPICVAGHLKQFLPGNPVIRTGGENAIHAISSAPWGSAGILAISYAYIAMMGTKGLTDATKLAILNANYIKDRLKGHYNVLYIGKNDRCAHEMIIDCRAFKKFGVEVEDIAKRLMDYGFHAPTVSFPVPGTLMIEPTESETMAELDRFCDALTEIRAEIKEVEDGVADRENNVLKNAPHIAVNGLSENWDHPYSRVKAFYPLPFVRENKFWPSVGRIDSAYGDRNLVCSCIPVEAYQNEQEVLTT